MDLLVCIGAVLGFHPWGISVMLVCRYFRGTGGRDGIAANGGDDGFISDDE